MSAPLQPLPSPLDPPASLVAALGSSYELRHLLGAGAEAAVWLARDLRTGALVALKHFPPRPGRRALHELGALLPLRHPRIVPLRDFCYLPAGDMVIASDYLPGGSLRAGLDRSETLAPELVLALAEDILGALDYLHARGTLHRDIKPDNILVASDAATGAPAHLLADFGVAGSIVHTGHIPDGVAGSPGYLAPECFSARALPASDLYSLGITLYELLSGRRPFEGDAHTLARAHLFTAPAPLPASVPADLASLILQLLAKDPCHRPASARAALALVQTLRSGAPLPPPVATPAPFLPPLAFGPASRLVLRAVHILPAVINRIGVITLGGRPALVCDEGSHLALHDAATGAPLRILLSKSGSAYRLDDPEAVLRVLGRRVLRWDIRTRQETLLAEPSWRATHLALHPALGLLATTDGVRVGVERLDGGTLPRFDFRSTEGGTDCQLVWLRDPDRLAVTSGVLRPEVRLFAPDGSPLATSSLPGPLLEGPRHLGAPLWLVVDHLSSARLIASCLGSDGAWSHHALPEKVTATDHAPDGLLALLDDSRLIHLGLDGTQLPLGALPAGVNVLALSTDARHLVASRPAASGTEFMLYTHQHA